MIPLLITFLAGISIAIGALVIILVKDPHKIEHFSIALAFGSLLSLMVFDLIPEIYESIKGNVLKPWWILIYIIIGFAILKILDLFVPEHEDNEQNHDKGNAAHIGIISALAVILHNIIEGMTVYSLSLSGTKEGIIFALGISLHNIPMGMLIYSTIRKHSKKIKITLFSVVALSTLIGGLLMLFMQQLLTETLICALICVALGMIIYIVFAELLPHILKTKPIKNLIIAAIIGFAIVMISCLIGG